jgi:zinc-ribbon domain
MSSITCSSCGAEIVGGSRFCRRCGQPAPPETRAGSSVLEAETRVFATPTDYAPPTQHINSPLTGPAYMSPGQMPTPPAVATQPLKPSGSMLKFALIGLVLLFLLLIPVSFGVMHLLKSRTSQPQQPTTPVVADPELPRPPQPPAPVGSTPADSALIYPGAETTLNLIERGKGRVLQLHTSDPFDKVVAWYVEKLKLTNTTKVPGLNVTVLRGEGINVVITAKDEQTDIIINQGSDE